MEFGQAKNLELDKICRVCLGSKKDMRPLFGEMVADMLMQVAQVQIENTDGWPDKICVQCVQQVSRCHAFKTRVEKSDRELRHYIKKLTVIVEEPITQLPTQHHHLPSNEITLKNLQTRHVPATIQASEVPPQMVIANGQLHNAHHILNGAQIVTHDGQHLTQIVNAEQLGQLLQSGNVQMIHPNLQQGQVVQIQQTADNQCEMIVQETLDEDDVVEEAEAHYVESVEMDLTEEEDQDGNIIIQGTIEEVETKADECCQEEEDNVIDESFSLSDESDNEDKYYLAEFISLQTSSPAPGIFICNLCRKEFRSTRWIQNHMKSHSNWIRANCKRPPQCEICHKSFKGPGMLRMHMKIHETANRVIVCNICNKEFKSKPNLYRHRQTHQMKSYQCGICLRTFTSSYTLLSHMTKKHADGEYPRKYKCAHCDEVHMNIDDLKNHIQTAEHKEDESSKLPTVVLNADDVVVEIGTSISDS